MCPTSVSSGLGRGRGAPATVADVFTVADVLLLCDRDVRVRPGPVRGSVRPDGGLLLHVPLHTRVTLFGFRLLPIRLTEA